MAKNDKNRPKNGRLVSKMGARGWECVVMFKNVSEYRKMAENGCWRLKTGCCAQKWLFTVGNRQWGLYTSVGVSEIEFVVAGEQLFLKTGDYLLV